MASVDDHLSVTLSPRVIELSSNHALTVGGRGLTVHAGAVVGAAAGARAGHRTLKPPALDGVYVFVPEVAVEPIAGDPLHALASVDDQFSVTVSPRVIELSSNHALTVGPRVTRWRCVVAAAGPRRHPDAERARALAGVITLVFVRPRAEGTLAVELPPAPVQVTAKSPMLDGV